MKKVFIIGISYIGMFTLKYIGQWNAVLFLMIKKMTESI